MGDILKDLIKKTAFKAIALEPVLDYMRKTRLNKKIVIVMYHEIARDHDDIESWMVVKESDFMNQMKYLSNHYDILSLEEILEFLKNPPAKAGQRPVAAVTFDDGYAGNYNVLLPLIEEAGIPVSIFVSTRAVKERTIPWYDTLISAIQSESVLNIDLKNFSLGEFTINRVRGADNWSEIEKLLIALKSLLPSRREAAVEMILRSMDSVGGNNFYRMEYMTIDELRLIADCPLVTIGAHSHCHNILPQLSEAEIEETVNLSKKFLEEWLERPIKYFAYPNGMYDNRVIEAVKKSGFECALTTEQSICSYGESLYKIPRLGFGRYDPLDLFKIRVSGGLQRNNLLRPGEMV